MRKESSIDLPDLDSLSEKRGEVRYGLTGLVPATVQADGKDLDVVMLDVSRGGLGILASNFNNRVGDVLRLCLEGGASIDLTVCWMRRPRLGDNVSLQGVTRVGLMAQSAQENLLNRFEPYACIDQ